MVLNFWEKLHKVPKLLFLQTMKRRPIAKIWRRRACLEGAGEKERRKRKQGMPFWRVRESWEVLLSLLLFNFNEINLYEKNASFKSLFYQSLKKTYTCVTTCITTKSEYETFPSLIKNPHYFNLSFPIPENHWFTYHYRLVLPFLWFPTNIIIRSSISDFICSV